MMLFYVYIMTRCYLLFTFISRSISLYLKVGNIFYFISLSFLVVFFSMTGISKGWGQPETCKRCAAPCSVALRGREGHQTSPPSSATGRTQWRKRHRVGRAGGTGSYCNGANHIASVHALRSHQTLHLCGLPAPASDGQETKFPRGSARSFPKGLCQVFSQAMLYSLISPDSGKRRCRQPWALWWVSGRRGKDAEL